MLIGIAGGIGTDSTQMINFETNTHFIAMLKNMEKENTTHTKYKRDGRYMSYRRRNRELSFAMEGVVQLPLRHISRLMAAKQIAYERN